MHAATVRTLQERIEQMQPLRLGDAAIPVHPHLRPLLPGGGLRRGSTVVVSGSLRLALALMAHASASGAWCGAIGVPEVGVEAAAALGIALERFVLVPRPGAHTISITGTLSEVLTIMLVRPPRQMRPGEAERVAARVRDHGGAVIALDAWPRADSTLRVATVRRRGLGEGHGLLETTELTVHTEGRRGPRRHRVAFRAGQLVADTPTERA